jgi:thioredoxin-related protein
MKKLLILLFVFLYLEGSNNLYKRGELVIDKQNNLIWQDTKDNIMLRMTQEKAIEHCEKLSFSGLSNW